jgi:hypothetical protein
MEDDEPEENTATDENAAPGESGDPDDPDAGDDVSESKTSKYAKKWFGVTSSQRRWAQKLGVDPYSGNTVLQEKIAAVAKVDATANFAAKLVTPNLGVVGYVVDVSNLVWSLDGEELRAHNLKQLKAVGITEEQIDAFLDNPAFSPTHQSFIVQAMVEMKDVADLDMILQLPDWAETESDAWFYTETITIMSRFHRSEQPVKALAGDFLIPAAVTSNDDVAFIVPVDYVSWSATLSDMLTGPMASVAPDSAGSRELWIRGQASESAAAAISDLGWSIKTGVKLEPLPPADQEP